jgi:tRNA A37 threonylcarbamoyladenosine biosynthesis protein TsaE
MAGPAARSVLVELEPGELHRHRTLIEVLFNVETDVSAYALGSRAPNFTAAATFAGAAAFLGKSVEEVAIGGTNVRVVTLAVCGATMVFRIANDDAPRDGNLPSAPASLRLALRLRSPSAMLHDTASALAKLTIGHGASWTSSRHVTTAFSRKMLEQMESRCPAVSRAVIEQLAATCLDSLTRRESAPVTVLSGAHGSGKSRLAGTFVRELKRAVAAASPLSNCHYFVTRTIAIAPLLALCELGDVDEQLTLAATLLREALDDATNGYPFTSRRSAALNRRPQFTNPALVVIEDVHLLRQAKFSVRVLTATLRHWLQCLVDARCAGVNDTPVPPIAVLMVINDPADIPGLWSTAFVNDVVTIGKLSMMAKQAVIEQHGAAPVDAAALPDDIHTVAQLNEFLSRAASSRPTQLSRGITMQSQTPLPTPLKRLVGLGDAIDTLQRVVLEPLRLNKRVSLSALGLKVPKGALVLGPTGCGKTALLAAMAKELDAVDGVRTILVDAHALIQKEVGESEKNVARVFAEARASSPCVVFIDGLDAIAQPRGRHTAESDQASDRVLSTLLVEMDGIAGGGSIGTDIPRSSTMGAVAMAAAGRSAVTNATSTSPVVVVIASAPSIDVLDAAVRRSGRLDVHVHLPAVSAVSAVELMHQLLPVNGAADREGHASACLVIATHLVNNRSWQSYAHVRGYCQQLCVEAVREITSLSVAAMTKPKSEDELAAFVRLVAARVDEKLRQVAGTFE